MVPAAHLLADFSYTQHNHFIYKENNVKVARSARVGKCVVLGEGTVLEEGVEISNCVIGPNCTIKRGAKLSHCHVWEQVVVESDVSIVYSIIGNKCVIKEGASVGKGSLLSSGVVIGRGMQVPEFTRLSRKHTTACSDDEDSDSEEEEEEEQSEDSDAEQGTGTGTGGGDRHPFDAHVVGSDGVGYLWNFDPDDLGADFGLEDEDDSDEEGELGAGPSHMFSTGKDRVEALRASSMGCKDQERWKHCLWAVCDAPVEEEESDSEEESSESGSEEEDGEGEERVAEKKMQKQAAAVSGYIEDPFQTSVSEWVVTGHEQNDSADNLLLEIKGLKFAQNKVRL